MALGQPTPFLTALALATLLGPGSALAGTCGVLPFAAGDDVKRGAAPNITQLVSSELDIRGGYSLVIAAPAEDFEGGDCGSSPACIREFGIANKHEAVVSGSVDMVGDDYALVITLHDANTAKSIRSVEATVPSAPLELASAVTDVVEELVTGQAPVEDEDTESVRFDDLDFDDMMDEAVAEAETPRKRSPAAPRNPSRDRGDFIEGDEGEDPFGLDDLEDLDELDMSPAEIERANREREAEQEAERRRKADEERARREREREREERDRLAREEREREERARRDREERERQARLEQERREEEDRRRIERERREEEERERARLAREEREREERDRARRDRERQERERLAREERERQERERQAREELASEPDEQITLGSALGTSGGILIGSALDDDEGGFSIGPADDEDDEGGFTIGPADDEDDALADDEPREGMIIGDEDDYDDPGVRRRRAAEREESSSDDRYARARSFGRDASSDRTASRDDEVDLDREDRSYDSRTYDDEDLDALDGERSYAERSYGSERVASTDDEYLDGRRDFTTDRGRTRVDKSATKARNRPYFSARVSGGYTNYYLHFVEYGVDIGIFPVPRVSVDLAVDFWTLSIRECPECEQEYRTLPSFYVGGSYRFTNLRIVQPYVGGDVGGIVYAIDAVTDVETGTVTSRRPNMGFAFAAKGGADFMFTRHFGLGVGLKFGGAYAAKIQEKVHPDWKPFHFLLSGKVAAVVQF